MLDKIYRSSAKERGKRLRLIRKMSGLTLEELSARYGIGASTIKYWECAKNKGLSSKGANKVIIAMQHEGVRCSYMWLMHGIGLPPQFIDVYCHNDDDLKNINNVEGFTYEEESAIESEITLLCENNPLFIVLTIFDDSMEPFYSINDSIGGKRLYGDDISKAIGKNCIIETTDHQLLCRRVAQGNEHGSFNLYSINPHTLANPPHLYGVKLLSAAPISRIWKRMVF